MAGPNDDNMIMDYKIKCPTPVGEVDIVNQMVVKVEGLSTLLLEPDVIEFYFRFESVKDSVDDVKKSISKRVDYLLQVVKNAKLKGDKHVLVHEILNKKGDIYRMEAEVLVKCDTLQKYEEIRNIAVEKLEGTVSISEPRFYHTHKCLQEGRVRVLRQALSSAKAKAVELATGSQQSIGPAVVIQELETEERTPPTLQEAFSDALALRTHSASRLLFSRVQTVYELNRTKTERS